MASVYSLAGMYLCALLFAPFLHTALHSNTLCEPIILESEYGFICVSKALKKRKIIPEKKITISTDNKTLFINGVPTYTTDIILTPPKEYIFDENGTKIKLFECTIKDNHIIYTSSTQHSPPLTPNTITDKGKKAQSTTALDTMTVPHHALQIKVLINEIITPMATSFTINILPDDQWIIKRDQQPLIKGNRPLVITSDHSGKIFINKKLLTSNKITIHTQSGLIGVAHKGENYWYKGGLIIKKEESKILLINFLDLEEYVASVLHSEGWPGWPLEVNKVLAIVSRTYALSTICQSEKANKPYHIKNTNHHQTYKGVHSNKILYTAVQDTKGQVITYNNKPILAMFDSCCGGIIPSDMANIDFKNSPYLARKHPCTHCKRTKFYNWKTEYSIQQLQEYIKTAFPKFKTLKDIKVVNKDKAGLVQKIHVLEKKGAHPISGKKLYSLLKGIKSYHYSIKKHNNTVIIEGRGYGHHLGLCQWGAREMVRDGMEAFQIISFFYPGTHIQTLQALQLVIQPQAK